MTEIFSFCVKHHRAIVVHIIRTQPPQHVQHAVQRTRGRAVGRGKLRHRVIGAVEIGRAVDEQEGGAGRHVQAAFAGVVENGGL